MDPQTDLPDLVEDLEVNIDELSTALRPLLSTPLHTTASSLPLLDKAKLYVLAAYSIESLLFSALQASGANAKEHAIFAELARLKGYFGKIKGVEERGSQPKARLDVGAAQRFIRHGLSGNKKYDLERAERMAKERARAALKAKQINKKFDEQGEEKGEGVKPKKRRVDEVEATEQEEDDTEILGGLEEPEADTPAEPATKKARISAADLMDVDSAPSPSSQSSTSKKAKRKQKRKKRTKQSSSPAPKEQEAAEPLSEPEGSAASTPAKPAKKNKHQKQRGNKSANRLKTTDVDKTEETILPARAPMTRSATFHALLDGSFAEKGNKGKGTKGRGKGK